jgi:hypothetical protein
LLPEILAANSPNAFYFLFDTTLVSPNVHDEVYWMLAPESNRAQTSYA